MIGVAPERDGKLADALDQLEGVVAFLLTNHVAQDAAQKTDVFDQRAFVVSRFGDGRRTAFGGADGLGAGGFSHDSGRVVKEGGSSAHASIVAPLRITNRLRL